MIVREKSKNEQGENNPRLNKEAIEAKNELENDTGSLEKYQSASELFEDIEIKQ